MHIAVTDYDGTLGDFNGVNPEVMDAVRAWREAGNLFGIATGRSQPMINREIVRNNIPFDFLICCNGAVVLNDRQEPVVSNPLPDELLPRLVDYPGLASSIHIVLCQSAGLEAIIQDENTWLPKVGIPVKRITRADVDLARNVLQISLGFPSPEESARQSEGIRQDFSPQVQTHPNGECLDITRSGVDKGEAVAQLLNARGWASENVLTIGDGENDLQMIRRFNGFTVPDGRPAVREAARGVYSDVGVMLRDHM